MQNESDNEEINVNQNKPSKLKNGKQRISVKVF